MKGLMAVVALFVALLALVAGGIEGPREGSARLRMESVRNGWPPYGAGCCGLGRCATAGRVRGGRRTKRGVAD